MNYSSQSCRRSSECRFRRAHRQNGIHGRALLVVSLGTILLLLFCLGAIGVVSPFAGGSTADGGAAATSLRRQQQQQQSSSQDVAHRLHPIAQQQHYEAPETHSASRRADASPLFRKTSSSSALSATSAATVPPPPSTRPPSKDIIPKKSSSFFRVILWNLNPLPGRKDGRWKGGESQATLASRLLFSYVSPLLSVASNRTLTEDDAFAVADSQKMNVAVGSLTETYEEVRQKAQRKLESKRQRLNEQNKGKKKEIKEEVKNSQSMILLKALVKYQRSALILTGCMRLCNTAIQAFPAILVSRLLRSMEAGTADPASKAVKSALMLVGVLSTKMIVENQLFNNVVNMSTQVRGALEGLIFDKSLRLPDGGSGVMAKQPFGNEKKALGSGGVLNLMQSDASQIESAAMQVHTIWDGPLQIAMYIYLLFQYLGPSVLYGLAVLLTVIPLNAITLRILDRLSQHENEAKKARTKRTNESISNMKLLKVQSWESSFARDIERHRSEEMNRHRKRGVVRAINSAISNAVPAFVLVVTLVVYAKSGKPILASTIFTAISLFNQLRFPLFFYPMLLDSLANGKTAMKRISSYLTSEEVTPYVNFVQPTEGGRIEMRHGSFLWATSQEPQDGEVAPPESPALCNVNLEVKPGEVVACVGQTGSGKSALIKALLGELAPVPKILVVDNNNRMTNSSQTQELMKTPEVTMHGKVGYCSQDAWLPKGTLRDAVLFGREYDEVRYQKAIYDAGLDQELSSGVLSADTDVGEKGSNLSGGQRARVSLARALYSGEDTKVFLLDDCFAALDARVGSIVFERVTKRLKEAKAATILVTNDPSLPRRCDRTILMGPTSSSNDSSTCSTIIDSGTYDQLISRGHQLQSFSSIEEETISIDRVSVSHENKELGSDPAQADMIRVVGGYKVMTNDTDCSCHADPEYEHVDVRNNPDFIAERVIPRELELEMTQNLRSFDDATSLNNATMSPTDPNISKRIGGLVSMDDKMTTDAVPISTYMGYLRAVGSPTLILGMLASFAVADGARFFQQLTVAKWTEVAGIASMSAALQTKYLNNLLYAAGVVSVFLWLRSFLTMIVAQRASQFYHKRMLSSVFRAPMTFFDATPSGQILSRFGRELEIVDRQLPESVASVLFCALQIMSSILALSGAITPAMIFPLTFAGSFYVHVMRRFRPAARDMKRTEQRTRTPIFTHFNEALRGCEVIRSIPGAVQTWKLTHRRLADRNLAVFSTVKALDRWLSISLEAIGNSLVFVTAMASIFLTRSKRLQAGSAGWGLTQAMAITGLMAWAVRNLTMLESHMMSVVRISELTDIDAERSQKTGGEDSASVARLPKEQIDAGTALKASFSSPLRMRAAPVTDQALIADGWPWKGGILFKNVSMRYNDESPLVLNGVNLAVPPGTTLGVVGRTGSGKSSLLLTLFRIVEIEAGGSIEIDGVDIRSISINTLRESLAIIPQDPVLFEGSVASNLDATGKASAPEMWAALEAASPDLTKQFRSSGGLQTQITEGGGNLSQGQRQLMCLARAMIRKSKILVMDEATSSVDSQTDQQVQDTIRKQFVEKGVSVVTVAHRLDTVLGYDKIAVLGDGKLLEYGPPSTLLKNRSGELRRLVDADRVSKRKGGKSVAALVAV